jgi:exopolysaccharide biosynthesis polyprenyl glycosylphosphotransferase
VVSDFEGFSRASFVNQNGTSYRPAGRIRSESPYGAIVRKSVGAPSTVAPAPPVKRIFKPRWETQYARAVIGSDLTAMLAMLAVGVCIGIGETGHTRHLALIMAAIIAPGFTCAMASARAWDPRVFGSGSEEYSRLLKGVVSSSLVLALVGLAFDVHSIRPWVFAIIPGGGVLAAAGRYVLRRSLHRRRSRGACLRPVLAIGSEDSIADLIARTRRAPQHGWTITSACTPTGAEGDIVGVPVVGDLDSVSSMVAAGECGVVAVAPAPGWTSRRLHELAWDLEGTGVDLVVHPGLMEVSGPRLHVSPVDGLPLLRLTEPTFSGIPRLVKAAMDLLGASLLLLLLAPLLLAIYLAVRADGGPALFRQTRIGKDGRPFRMLKYRTMVVDAERLLESLNGRNEGQGPLFKIKNDPRVTAVGGWLRRYSLDELPQLFNVLLGSMSLVGPRPPLPSEVACYARDAQRKLLVKPGLTGLWQISGRSDLSWEESLRLDLRYVENWTLALDGLILWKTIKAVISGDGAY